MQGSMQASQPQASAVIGSKNFTESVILGEIGAALGPGADTRVEHRRQLGGTRILWRALLEGGIDAYPEYTGTLAQELLQMPGADIDALRAALAQRGLAMTDPLGFDNSYALGMDRSEEHTSELQSLMRISYAVFCLKKTNKKKCKHTQLRDRQSDMRTT